MAAFGLGVIATRNRRSPAVRETRVFSRLRPTHVRFACGRCGSAVPAGSLVISEPSMPDEGLTYLCRQCFWATRQHSRSSEGESRWQPARLCAVLLTSAAVVWIAGRAARPGLDLRSRRSRAAGVPSV
jgi:hypothetical protein